MNKQIKIAVFFGGKISQHLVLVKRAAKKLGVNLTLVSYNRICFDSKKQQVLIRPNLAEESKIQKITKYKKADDYDVLFFRTTGKHWEEVNLIVHQVKSSSSYKVGKGPIIIDPLVEYGKPDMACKAWQMLMLEKAGIEVPRTVYGSLWYLYETMKNNQSGRQSVFVGARPLRQCTSDAARPKNTSDLIDYFYSFPVIVKGSGGDRGTRVFKVDNLVEMEKLVRDLRKSETDEGKRYMLQEYIPNDGDFRVLVLGDKVLGVMKRSSQSVAEFKNNYSAGGKVEVAELPEEIKELALKAAKVCGLAVAGVDVAFRDNDLKKPIIWEVNKGPQFKGFMQATGIDVPAEIVKFLVNLKKEEK